MARRTVIDRKTGETDIHLELDLDGTGQTEVSTGVGFLDHMLTLFARHGSFDLVVRATGDRHIDDHHSVEDVGICLGSALASALGDKRGIVRYGHMTLPMDEALVTTAVDLCGRVAFVWKVDVPTEKVGSFDTQLAEDFWGAVAANGRIVFHAVLHYGRNTHHIIEGVFKSAARSFKAAVAVDASNADTVPSTKGVL